MGCSSSVPNSSRGTSPVTGTEKQNSSSHENSKQDVAPTTDVKTTNIEEPVSSKHTRPVSPSEKTNSENGAAHTDVSRSPIGQESYKNPGLGSRDQSDELVDAGGGSHVSSGGTVAERPSRDFEGTQPCEQTLNGDTSTQSPPTLEQRIQEQENKDGNPADSFDCLGVDSENVENPSAETGQEMERNQISDSNAIDESNGKNEIVKSFAKVEVSHTDKEEIESQNGDCRSNPELGQVLGNSSLPNTTHQELPKQVPDPPENIKTDNANQPLSVIESCDQTPNLSENCKTDNVDQSQAATELEAGDQLEEHQEKFSQGLRSFCRLVDPSGLLGLANPHVQSLTLERAPADLEFPFRQLLTRFTGITELNLSGNQLGPQAFRVITLGMCYNRTIKALDISNNCADTDSSECLGEMLRLNSTLVRLDVSSNQLGRDFFSRCVGPSLGSNTTLKTLRASSCGFTDLDVIMSNLSKNGTLENLDVSHNQIRDSKVFAAELNSALQSPTCRLRSLHLRNCGLTNDGMNLLAEALRENMTLENLNVGGNKVSNISEVTNLLIACIQHPAMAVCNINDTGVTGQEPTMPSTNSSPDSPIRSKLTSLGVANCSLSDDIIAALANQLPGSLPNLLDLDLTGNAGVSAEGLPFLVSLMGANEHAHGLQTLRLGSLRTNSLPAVMQGAAVTWSNLRSLDLRRAKMTPAEVGSLGDLGTKPSGVAYLCLDGLKLSRSEALDKLLGTGSSCSMESLSLAGCALQDSDLAPITEAVTEGLAIQSLKLSANRITDIGVVGLMEAFVSRGNECTLVELNLADNKLRDSCADTVSKLICTAPSLHSLLLGHNALSGASLKTILASLCTMNSTSLRVLDLCSQDSPVDESEMEELLGLVAEKLGYKVNEIEGVIQCGASPLPYHPQGLTINLTGLGGSGETGQVLDCLTVKTDYVRVQRPWLALQHCLELSDWLRGSLTSECKESSERGQCSLTSSEWWRVLGSPKDPSVPSWLQVTEHRSRAVYMTGLSGGVSAGKLEGDLEAEADCLVKEVCIMKDFILRQPNGIAWVLMADDASVRKALEFFHEGKALMFSQPYVISQVKLSILTSDSETEDLTKARADLEARAQEAARENAEHRALLATSYQASQERHEYAKANPAYADGRIW